MTLVINEQSETIVAATGREGDRLWVAPQDVERATGWALKPEGLCRGDICVPLSPQRRADVARQADGAATIDIAGLWRGLGHPVVHDDAGDTWVLGTRADDRAASLRSLEAPDFRLPDLTGQLHALSELRGKKVFLATWASW